ncbi:MAG TPA: pyrroloquinoline quinone biosynthesis peptide chaperone PqqD [Thermoanaerobaculia bacterium]|nr:pyrroloquinoline quinone biosynthesis peptide chaperone PqqD [Thermoanaerobaculia bacterium]
MIEPETRLRRREGLLTQRADDTWVVLDPEDGSYYAFDEVSGRIWDLCDGSHTVAAVVETICAEYDESAETITTDVLEFLSELVDGDLVAEQS